MTTRRLCLGLITAAIFLGSCGGDTEIAQSDASYDRLLNEDVIRAGYVTYPPSFISDPNSGELSGISHDILVRAAENLNVKVEFVEELGWGSMIEAVNSGRVDIVATGIWPTAQRAKRANFIEPIFYSFVNAYVRFDDNRFDANIEAANSDEIKIATIDGEMASIIASSDFPSANEQSFTQISDVSQLLLEVASGKADITFVEPAIAEAYMEKNPGKIKKVKGVEPLRLFPNSYMVGKQSPKFQSTIDVAISELVNSGEVDRIIRKYEEFPGSFGRTSPPAQ